MSMTQVFTSKEFSYGKTQTNYAKPENSKSSMSSQNSSGTGNFVSRYPGIPAKSEAGKSQLPTHNVKNLADFIAVSQLASNELENFNFSEIYQNAAQLIANYTESFSTVVFLLGKDVDPTQEKYFEIAGHHTLSVDFVADARISYGASIIGWAAKNKSKVCVSPFEYDSRSLVYYSSDQGLKSFIAVPIINKKKEVIGVLACDSKKTYGFNHITEKILIDFAELIVQLVDLELSFKHLQSKQTVQRKNVLDSFLDTLLEANTEEELLRKASNIPQELVKRDTLLIITKDDFRGEEQAEFYSSLDDSVAKHRILELILRHKKILSGNKPVQSKPIDDQYQRSFLSVPFSCLGVEIGSFNLLSLPFEFFKAEETSALERISQVLSRELERLRLKERLECSKETASIFSWQYFVSRGEVAIRDALRSRTQVSLLRISCKNLVEFEKTYGTDLASKVLLHLMRLVEQIKKYGSISCYLYGSEILLFTDKSQVDSFATRLNYLLEKTQTLLKSLAGSSPINPNLSIDLAKGLEYRVANYPNDGKTIAELATASLKAAKF